MLGGVLILLLVTVLAEIPVVEAVAAPTEQFGVDDCSLYCAAFPELSVSRHLAPQERVRYDNARLQDGLATTAWVVDGGLGEWFEFVFRSGEGQHLEPRLGVNTLYILNGYRKSEAHWREHARVRELEVVVDGAARARVRLLDNSQPQRVVLPNLPLHPDLSVRFVVRGLYPGSRFKETAISEVRLDGYGHH